MRQDARRAASAGRRFEEEGLVYRRLSTAAAVAGRTGTGTKSRHLGRVRGRGLFEGGDRGRRVRAEAAAGPDGSRGGEGAAEARTTATRGCDGGARRGGGRRGRGETRGPGREAPSAEATAELMEALMAEARDDYEEAEATDGGGSGGGK